MSEEKKLNVYEKLCAIQCEIKAPKNMYNSFGKYNYRNAEGICEAVKPYLLDKNCSLTLIDEVVMIGERYYVKATATLVDNETTERVCVSALAREENEKKGMDSSQLTGATSSYARKYALNGLFLLDDTKDADTDEFCQQTGKEPKNDLASEKQIGMIKALCKQKGKSFSKWLEALKVTESTLTKETASLMITQLNNLEDKA